MACAATSFTLKEMFPSIDYGIFVLVSLTIQNHIATGSAQDIQVTITYIFDHDHDSQSANRTGPSGGRSSRRMPLERVPHKAVRRMNAISGAQPRYPSCCYFKIRQAPIRRCRTTPARC
jgi:hypothetical protein